MLMSVHIAFLSYIILLLLIEYSFKTPTRILGVLEIERNSLNESKISGPQLIYSNYHW
jgi:hypothetical protein